MQWVYSDSMIRPLETRDIAPLIDLLNAADAEPSLRTFAPDGRTVEVLALELGDDSPAHESLAFVLEQDSQLIAFANLISEDDEHVIEGPVMAADASLEGVAKLIKRVLAFAPQRHYEFIDAFVDEENHRAQLALRQAGMQAFRTTYLYELTRAEDTPAHSYDPQLELVPIQALAEGEPELPLFDVGRYRDLYRDTTDAWHDRLAWSDEELIAHFAREDIALIVAYYQGERVGHIELEYLVDSIDEIADSESDTQAYSEVEIAYFGVLKSARKRGVGKALVHAGVELAFVTDSVETVVARAHDDERAACHTLEALGFHLRQSVVGFTWELR
jgi:ribosomal protein S18 acetylase RimI-like enzyme